MNARRTLRAPLLAVLTLALVAVSAAAQDAVSLMYTAQVKSGMLAEFEAAVAVHTEWRSDQNDPWVWNTFQDVNGATLNQFKFRSGGHTWADIDAYADFNTKAAAHFRQVVSPYIESLSSILIVSTDISRTAAEGLRPMYNVANFYLRPGQTASFLAALRQFHEAVGATGFAAEYNVETVVNGGRGDVVRIVSPLDSWADMEQPSPTIVEMMIGHLGEDDATEVFNQFNGAIQRSESSISVHRPDLSVPARN